MAENTPTPRLYAVAVFMTNGSSSLLSNGYRGSSDPEDVVLGRYMLESLDRNPGYSIFGKPNITEITEQELNELGFFRKGEDNG